MRLRGRSLEVESDVEDEELERVVQEKTESQQREADGDLVEKRRDVDRGTDYSEGGMPRRLISWMTCLRINDMRKRVKKMMTMRRE